MDKFYDFRGDQKWNAFSGLQYENAIFPLIIACFLECLWPKSKGTFLPDSPKLYNPLQYSHSLEEITLRPEFMYLRASRVRADSHGPLMKW